MKRGNGGKDHSEAPHGGFAAGADISLSQAELIERIGWLIKLRWVAFAGVLATILISRALFTSSLPWGWLILTAFIIPAYNLACYLAWQRANSPGVNGVNGIEIASSRLVHIQILCDLLVLGALIHFSGGIENPFGFYFIFHMVIASILLSRKAAFLQATVALVIFAGVVLGEYYKLIPHYYSPVGMQLPDLYLNEMDIIAALWVMATGLYATVYLATCIAVRLRWREDQIVALSRQARRDADQIRVAYDRLADTEKVKSAYMRKVAHELRSPLAGIESLLRVVSDGLAGDVPEDVRTTIDRARYRPHGLVALVGDLLALAAARDTRRSYEPVDIDLRSALDGVVLLLAPQAESRKINIETEVCPVMPCMRGDPEGIEQVLTNLVSNAIKYSPDGATVQVCVSHDSGQVAIEVSDAGIGIDEKDTEKVFEEFYRTSTARNVRPEGTGLGLSIVRSIVDAHGGTIEIESQLGVGTKFTVRLPASELT